IRQPTVKSYLFTIARNAYTDLLRRAARHTQVDKNMPDTRVSAQTQLEQTAEVRAVLAALQQLPEIDRSVLLMRALDGMPYEEIAETLGIPLVTAKVKAHRARLKLMQTRQAWRGRVPAPGKKTRKPPGAGSQICCQLIFSARPRGTPRRVSRIFFTKILTSNVWCAVERLRSKLCELPRPSLPTQKRRNATWKASVGDCSGVRCCLA